MSSTTPPPRPTSLTERRKAETRREIARAAAGLFVRHGLRATRAEDIAQAAGIAPRTFYRYFATKEEAVAPLYATGAERWVEAVRAAPSDAGVLRALEEGVRHTLTPGFSVSASSWEWVRTLLRLAEATPSLCRVWAEVCRASERRLGEVLAERVARAGAPAVTTAVFEADGGAVGGAVVVAPGGDDNVAVAGEPPALTPELRFAAAVASAAVRAALEAWAAGDGPVDGPDGPAELALRNLAALRDFPWGR
ncbi:TetR/AcrR family transcriptional regulator [Streptomyces indiaensis]|uniref:TetR/AcrR family transcriptional regulator n=1 Tax=Streptomyces indiaensis TaxID=284033 RepID=UPI001F183552|nr:TetR family transcriptional regulator [Streptomyces indiaensis]MCF1649825.1 TetR/AcrR family transcriptional regulator [Streptomyces indiaensis]